MDLQVEVPFSMAAHAAAPSRLSALLLPPPPAPPPPPGTTPNAVAAAAAAAAALAVRQALPVGEVCLLTAVIRVTAPCEVRVCLAPLQHTGVVRGCAAKCFGTRAVNAHRS